MKYADLPKKRLNHLVKPADQTLEEWQVMLRMQQAQHEAFEVECVSERYNPGEYRVRSPKTGGVYKVVYRGPKSPWNFCECMDFKTSQLGTCKHIEAARQWIADHHKRIHWDLPAYTSVYLSYRSNERSVRIRIGQTREADFKALASRYFDQLGALMPQAYEYFGDFLAAARSIDSSFRCYPDARDFVIEQREAIARRKRVDEKYPDAALDSLLHTSLYPYQKEGVRFAARAGRAILADEMGLGKTVQAIATAELLRREGFVGSTLVLCPTTLKYQWKREIERFTDQAAVVVEGTAEARRALMEGDAFFKIASYSSLTPDLPTPDLLILDEVQRLKNWNTQAARAVRRIKSRYTLILSGTPLENRLEELYSVVELVDQFLLSPYYVFKDRYILTDADGRTVGYRGLSDVRRRLEGVMLRRRKADVALQLPPRIDKYLFVPMTQKQMEAHTDLKQQAARLVTKWHRQHFLSEMDRKQLLLTLSQMRMVCDSLYVLDQHSRADTKVEEVMNLLDESGVTVNGEAADGDAPKVVIFSQWERMTRLVAEELERSGVEYVYLHGSVPAAERQARVQTFQSDPSVRVFLSTDAGATGLNLQAASLIINLDLPWNPAVLEQRIGRIHRIGQQRGVEVIHLIAAGTIEDDMRSRLRFKTSLFDGVLDGGEDAVFLSSDKFDALLTDLASLGMKNEESGFAQNEESDSSRKGEEDAARKGEEGAVRKGEKDTARKGEEDAARKGELNLPFEDASNSDSSFRAKPDSSFFIPSETSPLLRRLTADLAELLQADEDTRKQAAEWLKRLLQ